MNHAVPEADFSGAQRIALLAGALGIIACIVGVVFDRTQFFRSYLLAYVFWISIALGSLGIILLHNLVGGRWGVIIRQFVESAVRTLPYMAVLVIPLLIGIPVLYEWSHADVVARDPILRYKQPYLNTTFFIIRTVFYFLVWLALPFLLRTRPRGNAPDGSRAVSGPGLIIFVFTVTFASVDWIMSLEPHWYSTIYGAIFMVGQVLETLAFCIALLFLLSDRKPFASFLESSLYHDLGNLMLAFTCLWAYTSFSQYLIIWSGNIPEETPWYIHRSHGGWQAVAGVLMVLHFIVPFMILLSRYVKRRGRLLARVAVGMIIMRMVDLIYWIVPSYHGSGFALHWIDFAAAIGLGGVWIWLFLSQLKRTPLLDVNDPRIQPQEAHH